MKNYKKIFIFIFVFMCLSSFVYADDITPTGALEFAKTKTKHDYSNYMVVKKSDNSGYYLFINNNNNDMHYMYGSIGGGVSGLGDIDVYESDNFGQKWNFKFTDSGSSRKMKDVKIENILYSTSDIFKYGDSSVIYEKKTINLWEKLEMAKMIFQTVMTPIVVPVVLLIVFLIAFSRGLRFLKNSLMGL